MAKVQEHLGDIFWHRDLPPVAAEFMSERVIETSSVRVPGTIAHRDELWDRCYRDLMVQTHVRLGLEMTRLGGDYAHVLGESIDTRRDDAAGQTWLQGRFKYALFRRAQPGPGAVHSVVA